VSDCCDEESVKMQKSQLDLQRVDFDDESKVELRQGFAILDGYMDNLHMVRLKLGSKGMNVHISGYIMCFATLYSVSLMIPGSDSFG
jgi:hypothetical protein